MVSTVIYHSLLPLLNAIPYLMSAIKGPEIFDSKFSKFPFQSTLSIMLNLRSSRILGEVTPLVLRQADDNRRFLEHDGAWLPQAKFFFCAGLIIISESGILEAGFWDVGHFKIRISAPSLKSVSVILVINSVPGGMCQISGDCSLS